MHQVTSILGSILLISITAPLGVSGFSSLPFLAPISNACSLRMAGGGWGKRTKEYTNDEFASEGGDRRGFDSYELQERGEFLRRVRNDQSRLSKRRDEEFLEIAKMAGITDQAGDGVEPMGAFSVDDEDLDNLDVSVQWDEDDDEDPDSLDLTYDADASITRLDGDNDVSGALGQW